MTKFVLLFVWFIVTSGAVMFSGQVTQRDYDASLSMSQALMDMGYEQSVLDALQQLNIGKNTVVHINNKSFCHCDFLANPHQSKINTKIENSQITFRELTLTSGSPLSAFIPSSPSVIFVNDKGNIAYIGPYSSGLGCFSRDGEINQLLDAAIEGKSVPSTIRNEARGCYCSLS